MMFGEGLSTQSLLLSAFRAWAPRFTHALQVAGHRDVQPRHRTVFAHIDTQGTTVSTLSRKAKVAPSAMGSIVDELEHMRYLTRQRQGVGKAPLVVLTERGVVVMAVIRTFDSKMEYELKQTLGAQSYTTLRQSLYALSLGITEQEGAPD